MRRLSGVWHGRQLQSPPPRKKSLDPDSTGGATLLSVHPTGDSKSLHTGIKIQKGLSRNLESAQLFSSGNVINKVKMFEKLVSKSTDNLSVIDPAPNFPRVVEGEDASSSSSMVRSPSVSGTIESSSTDVDFSQRKNKRPTPVHMSLFPVSASPSPKKVETLMINRLPGENLGMTLEFQSEQWQWIVKSVVKKGPADRAVGIKKGDVILSINGIDLNSLRQWEMTNFLMQLPLQCRVKIIRGEPMSPRSPTIVIEKSVDLLSHTVNEKRRNTSGSSNSNSPANEGDIISVANLFPRDDDLEEVRLRVIGKRGDDELGLVLKSGSKKMRDYCQISSFNSQRSLQNRCAALQVGDYLYSANNVSFLGLQKQEILRVLRNLQGNFDIVVLRKRLKEIIISPRHLPQSVPKTSSPRHQTASTQSDVSDNKIFSTSVKKEQKKISSEEKPKLNRQTYTDNSTFQCYPKQKNTNQLKFPPQKLYVETANDHLDVSIPSEFLKVSKRMPWGQFYEVNTDLVPTSGSTASSDEEIFDAAEDSDNTSFSGDSVPKYFAPASATIAIQTSPTRNCTCHDKKVVEGNRNRDSRNDSTEALQVPLFFQKPKPPKTYNDKSEAWSLDVSEMMKIELAAENTQASDDLVLLTKDISKWHQHSLSKSSPNLNNYLNEAEDDGGDKTNLIFKKVDQPKLSLKRDFGPPFQVQFVKGIMGLGIDFKLLDGLVIITDIRKRSPLAEYSHVSCGDVIISINGEKMLNLTSAKVNSIIRLLPRGLVTVVLSNKINGDAQP